MKMQHFPLLVFVLFITLVYLNGGNRTIEWDVIVFTQQWVLTYCHIFRLTNETHKCNLQTLLPEQYWKVHGIWPTKVGTMGPNDCKYVNFTIDRFNREGRHYLEKMWTHIDAKNTSEQLWKNEWMKHGSCSLEIEQLQDQYYYLAQGMAWWRDFQLYRILEEQGVLPGAEYPLGNITGAIKKTIGKEVDTRCYYDEHTKTVFLNEILICFDKNLTLINCDLMQKKKKLDCGKEWDMVTYPDVVPQLYYESGATGKLLSFVHLFLSVIVSWLFN
ncbi:RNaseX25 family protein [Megaselia abdita]